MRRKSLVNRIIDNLPYVDIPMLMLMGAAAGFFAIGTVLAAFSVFSGTDYTPWTEWLWIGIVNIGLGMLIGGLAWLYWKFILSKSGVLFPAFSGFGLIFAFVTFIFALTCVLSMFEL